MIQNTLVKNLTKTIINRDGNPVLVPTFATAQELVDQLSAILNVSDLTINPTYDPDTGELLFTLVLQTQNALLGVPLSVDRQDLGVELATKGTSLTLTENGTLTFTFGAELLATSSPKLSTSSPGQGIQGPVIPLDGKLTHDSTFTLTDDQNRVMRVTVPASSTMDNTSPLDLVGDFNAALQEAGVTSIVAGLDTLNPVMVGSGTFPGDGKLATDSHFTLTVDKNAPVSITVPQSVTTINSLSSDLVDEYNAAIEAAGISTVAASIAPPTQEIDGAKSLPGNGQLSGDATFTLTIDGGAATTVKVTQSVSSSDASPSDLVNAVNAALRAAGLSNIMAGLKSRVVGGVGETVLMLYAVQANQFDTITLHVAASDPAATELGFSDGEVGDNQPSMRFSGVAGTPIHLLTLTTPANDPLVTQLGFQPTQSEGFVSARLTLTASATKFLRFNAAADDPAIAELGFANDQSSRSSTNSSFVQGMSFLGGMSLSSPTGGEIPTGSFGFLGIASHSFAASANAQIDINIKDPNTGIVGGRVSLSDLKGLTATITTTGDLTAGSTTVEIKGDATGLAVGQGVEGTGIPADAIVTALSGTTITLNKAATQSVMGISLSFSKAPSLVQTPTAIGNGTFSLGFMVPKLGVDDQNYSLDASLGDVENPLPSFTVDTSHTGPFQNYQFLDFNTVENSLQQATNYLTEQTAFQDRHGQAVLVAPLPVINKSIVALVDYKDALQRFSAQMQASPTNTLQDFVAQANTLLANFGVQAAVTTSLQDNSGTPVLGLDYQFTSSSAYTAVESRLDVNGVPNLLNLATGTTPDNAQNLNGVMRLVDNSTLDSTLLKTQGTGLFNIPTGLDLTDPKNPKPFLYDSNNLATLGVNINAPMLNGVPVSLGRLGLYVEGGSAYLSGDGATPTSNATYTIALANDPNSRNYFADGNLFTHTSVVVVGKAGVALPISLTPDGQGVLKPPLTIVITNLADLLDGVAGSVAPILAPSIAGYEMLFEMIDKTPNLSSGMNRYLLDFQNALNAQVVGLSYPIIGNQLQKVAQIFEQFRVPLGFQIDQDRGTPNPVTAIKYTMATIFGTDFLGWLVDKNGKPSNDPKDITVQTDGMTFANWSAHLHVNPALSSTQIGFDVGLPGLQMAFPTTAGTTQNTVDLKFGFDQVFNFGIDTKNGFNIDTSTNQPLTISVDAVPHVDSITDKPQPLSGTFGFFHIDVTPDLHAPLYPGKTEFSGTFTILPNGGVSVPGKLVYQDLLNNKFSIKPTLAAVSNTNLGLTTSYPHTTFSLKILSDYEMQWNFSTSDPDLRGAQPLAGFYGIGTNWSDAVSNFLGPGFKHFVDFLNSAPFGPVLDFLGTPLPVISYLLGPTDIVQFLGYLTGNPAAAAGFDDFLGVLNLFRDLYAAVPSGGYKSEYNLVIDQGDMVITQDLRTVTSLKEIVKYETPRDPLLVPFLSRVNAYEADPKNQAFTTDADGGVISGKIARSLNIGFANASISLPFFTDPKFVKSMLLGGTGDLFRLITPSAAFTLKAEVDFPPIPIGPIPLVIHVGGVISPSIQFGYGFDTRGYQLAAEGKGDDVSAEGSYFIVSKSILDVPLKLYFGAGVGIPDILTLSLDIFFLWDNQIGFIPINKDDPNPDTRDKFYIDQFSTGSGFFNDLELSGALKVGAQIDVGILFFHKFIEIWHPQTLFTYSTAAEPQLARLGENGTLRLNVGPSAGSRLPGESTDDDESITIRHVGGTAGNEDLEVSGMGATQVYHGVSNIYGDFGSGTNRIDVAPDVLSDAELKGEDGHNTLIYRGQGNVVLEGGRGDDDLEALGPGTAQIHANGGNDTLVAGPGSTTFVVNGGNDKIVGGTGDSVLQVSGGASYSLSDGALSFNGYTSTLSQVRHVTLTGDDGDNTFNVSDWSGDAVIDGGNGFDRTTVNLGGGGTVTIAKSGWIGRDSVTINSTQGGTLDVTPTQTVRGAEAVRYSTRLESLTLNTSGITTISLRGTAEGQTAIHGGLGTTTLNVLGTRDFSQTTFDGGPGNSIIHVGQGAIPGFATAPDPIKGGLILQGGSGYNELDVNLDGDLSNLLRVSGFDHGSFIKIQGDLTHALLSDAESLSTVDVTGSLGAIGAIRAGAVDQISLGGDLLGVVDVAGPIHSLNVGGSLVGSAQATSIDTLSIGRDLVGKVNVPGRIGRVDVQGATPGTIVANDIGVVTAGAATGPTVLNLVVAGVARLVTVTAVVNGDPRAAADRFSYVYDSNGSGDPELALRVVNPTGARFDLALQTGSSSQFTLARLDSVGPSGIHNLLIDGSLLNRVSQAEADFFGLPTGSPGGVNLPKDTLGVVAVRGDASVGSIRAAALQGVAFSSLTGPKGRTLDAARVDSNKAAAVLRRGTRLVQANGVFQVSVLEQHGVSLFFKTGRGRRFDKRPVRFFDTIVDGKSNQAHVDVGAGRAGSRIHSIRFTAPGGLYRTRQPIGPARVSVAAHPGLAARAVDAVLETHSRLTPKSRRHARP